MSGFILRTPPSGPIVEGVNQDDVLLWDVATKRWVPGPGGGSSGVASFNTRTGPVTSADGDYNTDQVTNESDVDGATTTEALNNLLAAIPAPSTTKTSHGGAVGTFPDIAAGGSASIDLNTFPPDMAPAGALVMNFDGPIDQVGLIVIGARINGGGTPIVTLFNATAAPITPSNIPFWMVYEAAPP